MEKKVIFISHIHEGKAIADAIRKFLHKHFPDQASVFISKLISYGADWFDWIKKELKKADLALVLFSPDSINQPWINIEAGYSIISDIQVIPACYLGLLPENLRNVYQSRNAINLAERSEVQKFLTETFMANIPEEELDTIVEVYLTDWDNSVLTAINAYLEKKNKRVAIKLEPQTYFQIFNDEDAWCLDVLSYSELPGAEVIGFNMHGGRNQCWLLERLSEQYYKVSPKDLDKLCLEVKEDLDKGKFIVQQNEWTGTSNQQWKITPLLHGNYKIAPRSQENKCLTIDPDKEDEGKTSVISLQTYGNNARQKWVFKVTVTPTLIL